MTYLTMSEKIFSQKAGRTCRAGDFVICEPDLLMSHDGNRPLTIDILKDKKLPINFDTKRFVLVIDHHTPAPEDINANIHKWIREYSTLHDTILFENEGICHQILPEKGLVLPGDLIIGTDSHTCTYGALNAFSTGVGTTDLAVALNQSKLWFRVPESIYIEINGTLPSNVYAKDLALFLCLTLGAHGATYMSLEFGGEGIQRLSMDSRLAICNMAVEMGAKAGLMPYDYTLEAWLDQNIKSTCYPIHPDSDAVYKKKITINLDKLVPMVAKPHNVDYVVPASELEDIPIHQANLAGCTNGRLEDLRVASSILKGQKIYPGVKLLVVPASKKIMIDAMEEGILQNIVEAGGVLAHPSCRGCSGGAKYGVPANGDNVIASTNRNFCGRLGNPAASIYLASPATVAASAVTGHITDCQHI